MNKNIKKNYFLKVKKVLDEVDKAGEIANHFRGVVLIGDQQASTAYSWLHASQKELETLIFAALKNSEEFLFATASAVEKYYKTIEEEKPNNKDNEDNQV